MPTRKLLNNPVQFWTYLCILLFGAFIFYQLGEYTNAFLGTIVFYVLLKPLMLKWHIKKGYNKHLVASGLIFLLLLGLSIPISLLLGSFVPKIELLLSDTSLITHTFYTVEKKILDLTGYKLMTDQNLVFLRSTLTSLANDLLNETLSAFANLLLLFFMCYFSLINVGKTERYVMSLLPFDVETINRFSLALRTMTYTNVIVSPLLAAVQALFAFLAYWLLGLDQPVFWAIMTGVFSFIPVLGSAMIWLPAAVYLYSSGMEWQGLAMLAYGVGIIGVSDNVFRFIFASKIGDVHPMITILGILLGFKLFGAAGFIFGPLLLSYFFLMIDVYRHTYHLAEDSEPAEETR
jgi:predicted PurR-regulated permease PerM